MKKSGLVTKITEQDGAYLTELLLSKGNVYLFRRKKLLKESGYVIKNKFQ